MNIPRFRANLTLPALALLGLAVALDAGEPLSVSSPDGAIELQIPAIGSSPDGRWSNFQVRFRGRALLQGELGLAVRGHDLLEKAVQKGSRVRASDTTYTVPFGESNPIRDHFNDLTLDLETAAGPARRTQLIFRAYDDGVAFRYVVRSRSWHSIVTSVSTITRGSSRGGARPSPSIDFSATQIGISDFCPIS